jgi:hypothetical protein
MREESLDAHNIAEHPHWARLLQAQVEDCGR